MEPKFFIGVDISKLTMDTAILNSGELIATFKIENSEPSVKSFVKILKTVYRCKSTNTVCCAENTGLYTLHLANVLLKSKIPVCLESALQIKRSVGIQRGKSDAVDAHRIAQYAMRNFLSLKFWEPPRVCLQQLKTLSVIRKRLIKIKCVLEGNEKMEAYYLPKGEKEIISSHYNSSLIAVKKDLESVVEHMNDIIQSDARLERLLNIQMSIPGIGKVIATQMIIATNEFIDFDTSRQFAAYCGVAPFEISSGGVSLGRTKVSHLANKELKALLHLGSMHFTRHTKYFLGSYYQRKVLEGKNKMSVLNAIRNKLLHRIFSCVKNDKLYIDN